MECTTWGACMRSVAIAFAVAILLMLIVLPQYTVAADTDEMTAEKATAKAVPAAEAWLKLVDSGAYEESWDQAAPMFKDRVQKNDWTNAAQAVREPLGPVEERTVETTRYATELPGAPDGHYVIIQFRTVFANKKNSVETVTPMLTDGGTWRVSGYYIK